MSHSISKLKHLVHRFSPVVLCMLTLAMAYSLSPITASADNAKDHIVIKQKKNKFGIVGKTIQHEPLVPFEYDSICLISDNSGRDAYYLTIKDRMKGIVKCSVAMYQDEVKWIVPCEYSALNVSKYGYVIVQKDSLLGVYSLYGDVILPCEYNSIAYDKDYDLFTITSNPQLRA